MPIDLEGMLKTGGFFAGVAALLGIVTGTLKGSFVTKKECQTCRERCVEGLQNEIAIIKNELQRGHNKFASTERYIVAIAGKLNVKPEDIPKL